MLRNTIIIALTIAVASISAQNTEVPAVPFTVAQLKYGGGGDWYANPSALPNLIEFARENAGLPAVFTGKYVEPTDDDFFNYPFIYMTGHGNVRFTDKEIERLRAYLTGGGFLHADDNYGMDESFRREIKRVFPNNELVELPFDHDIYHCFYNFPAGLPKIHEHDGKPAQGFGIFHEGRLVVFYTYETDLGDGWEDQAVHDNPEEVRRKALQMGTNIIVYVMTR
jgi:hypothetical protein